MNEHEGPSTITAGEYESCSGCKWLMAQMMKSGRDPEYWHYCQHPSKVYPPIPGYVLSGMPKGEYIGKDNHTPPWCPVRKTKRDKRVRFTFDERTLVTDPEEIAMSHGGIVPHLDDLEADLERIKPPTAADLKAIWRDQLGRVVREAWVAYCKETGDTKTSHITPWEGISEWDKEADRRIGEAMVQYVLNRLDP